MATTVEQKETSVDDQKKALLQHLESQYKIFRDEVRSYAGYAAASTTLLVLLLFYILVAARGKDTAHEPKLYVLILVGIIWYGALMAFFMSYIAVTAEYTEMLERKINGLLKCEVYGFESGHIFPSRKGRKEKFVFLLLLLFTGIPVFLGIYAGSKGLQQGFKICGFWKYVILSSTALIFCFEFVVVLKIRSWRRENHDSLLSSWAAELKENYSIDWWRNKDGGSRN